jgi:uncharacterized protein (TIGR02118 family)
MFCASVAYPMQSGGRFDFAYFAQAHAPLFARLLGANCVRFEVQRPLATPDAPPPAYQGVAHFWVRSGEEFGAALGQHGPEIYADIPRFTDIEPVRLWSEVVSQEGGTP